MKSVRILELADGAAHLLPFARKKLSHLHATMQYTGVPGMQRHFVIGDNEVHITASAYADDTIRITGGVTEAPFTLNHLDPAGDFNPLSGFDTAGWFDFSTASESSWTSLGLPAPTTPIPPFCLELRGRKVVRRDEPLRVQVRLNALARAFRREDLEFAEVILRRLDGTFGAIPTPPFVTFFSQIDGALYCDEGFLVDLTMYAAKSYYATLEEIVPEEYLAAFTHSPLPSPLPTGQQRFPEVDLTTYKPVGSFDNNPPHQFFYWNGVEEVIVDCEWSGYGTSGLNPLIISSSTQTLPMGATVICRRAQIASVGEFSVPFTYTGIGSSWKEINVATAHRLLFRENYYIVDVVGGSSFTAYHLGFDGVMPPAFRDGPMIGYAEVRGGRLQYRRGPSGWVEVRNEDIASQVIMPIETDGEMPYVTITPPPASAVTTAHVEHPDGTVEAYAQSTYVSGDINYGLAPEAKEDIYFTGPSTLSNGSPYPSNKVASSLGTEWRRHQLVTERGKEFYRTHDGRIQVRNADGDLVVNLDAGDPSAWVINSNAHSSPHTYIYSFEYPNATYPDLATFRADARVEISLYAAGPQNVTRDLLMPTHDTGGFGRYCVYNPRTEAVMYVRHVNSTTALQTAQSRVHRAYALQDPDLIASAWEQLRAEYEILANTGVPEEAALFATPNNSVVIL